MDTGTIRCTLRPEWAPQSGVMLAWPTAESDWRPWLAEVEAVYLRLAREIARREKLLIVCHNQEYNQRVQKRLAQQKIRPGSVLFHTVPFNDTWVRDYGPLSCWDQDGRPRLLDFTFNGWGNQYTAALDNAVTERLYRQGAFGTTPLQRLETILEGGSVETDGAGTLLTTARCLLSENRNPQLTPKAIEARLKQWLGAERILWLQHGQLAGDDTGGHIDTLARFCDPHTICYTACDDPADAHYPELQAMTEELQAFRTATGAPYRLVALPWPRPRCNAQGQRLPASYANFLIINGAVLVPTYRDPADTRALSLLQDCFPDRRVVGIDCLPLLQQYGSLHCLTIPLAAGIMQSRP